MQQHDLVSYIRQATQEMQSEYERIRARAAEDPGTAGDQGEENWAELFRKWLPGDLQIATKGRVLCADGTATNQVDIVALSPIYPRGMVTKKLHLASEVNIIVECKTTLKGSHIEKTMESANATKEAIYRSHRKEVLYGLVAHSHHWSDDTKRASESISEKISQAHNQHTKHPNNALDFVCVADLGSWILKLEQDFEADEPTFNTFYLGPVPDRINPLAYKHDPNPPPIGKMIGHISRRLSAYDEKYLGLAHYYNMAGLEGAGSVNYEHRRKWTAKSPGEPQSSARRGVTVFMI